VIKNNTDHETASKIAGLLNQAGALCTVEEHKKPGSAQGSFDKRKEKRGNKRLKIKVVTLEFGGSDIALAPLVCGKITSAEGGIDINRAEKRKIGYDFIEFISVFQDEKYKILIFEKDSKRPFLADCDTIIFPEFPNVKGPRLLVSVRKFIVHVLAKNSKIILDKGTYDFIRGDSPFVFREDVIFLTSAIKKALPPQDFYPYSKDLEGVETLESATEGDDGKREKRVSERCPKCGSGRVVGQEACNHCGLVFANWGQTPIPEYDQIEISRSPVEEQEPALKEDIEDDFDVEVALREVDVWSENYTRLFSIMLILGMLLPMIKYNELTNSTVIVWPWQIAGLAASESIYAALKGFSGGGNMILWTLIPIISGVAGLVAIKFLSPLNRSILASVLGMLVFFLLSIVFIEESRILGVMFLPWSPVSGILYIILLLSAGMIAAANHLRKRFKPTKLFRFISAGGGILLGLLACSFFIMSSGPWQALPMLILYALFILYAVLGIFSAYKNGADKALLSFISKTSRITVCWAFVGVLVTQSFYPDPTLAHGTAGSSLIHGLGTLVKCVLVYTGSAFMMVMGATALAETILLKNTE
jgi:hypothetical protein